MKKILFFVSALAGLFLAASCQQENLEPVAGNGQVTFTVEAPAVMQTKAIADGMNVNELIYEVWITSAADPTNLVGKERLFQGKETMFYEDGKNKAKVTLDLVNDQHYTVLFWAQVKEEGKPAAYITEKLTEVKYAKGVDQYLANDESLAAFYAVNTVNDGVPGSSTVYLKRPFAQVNLCTFNKRDVTNTVDHPGDYNVAIVNSKMTLKKVPTQFNVATSEATEPADFSFAYNVVPSGEDKTIEVNSTKYYYAGMNYVFAGDNLELTYDIQTSLNGSTNYAVVNNVIAEVPVKENHRTNIVGNLLTSKVDYDIIVDEDFLQPDEVVEVVSVSTPAELANAIENASSTEGESTNIKLEGDINLSDLFAGLTKSTAEEPKYITIPAGLTTTIDLNGYSLTSVDETEKSFGLITNKGNLTIVNSAAGKTGKIKLIATKNDPSFSRYSSVISTQPGSTLTVGAGVEIEHLGGTSMSYAIDVLTNGRGTSAVAVIDGATVKSPYRPIRQFLNGTEAVNSLTVKAGSVIKSTNGNKSIWMQDASAKANTGSLVVEEGAELYGNVYISATTGSTEWPVSASVAASALKEGSEVEISPKELVGYNVALIDGVYVFEQSWSVDGDEYTVYSAAGLKWVADEVNAGNNYFEGKTVKLAKDIDLKNVEWTPIGSAVKEHGFMGNFDGNGKTIKNLMMTQLTPDSDNYVYAGLFGVTEGTNAQENYIKNLVIENVTIETAGHIAAAAVAYPYYTTLENITVKGDIDIKGGDYTAGVLAYTRRCVNAKNIAIVANANSVIEGGTTVGGVISDIQMNGGLTANYSNFSASGLTIKATKSVGGISGIMGRQSLSGATVKNVTLVCNDSRTGIIVGAKDGIITIDNVSYENVTGATRVIGATWKDGYYFGQILEVAGAKAIIYSINDGVKAVSVEELNLNGKNWQNAMDWAEGLGGYLATIDELDDIHAVRVALNDILESDNAENVLFEEDDYYAEGKYALYLSSTEATGNDPQGKEYFANRVHLKYFNLNGYWDYPLSSFSTVNKYAPLKDGYFARAVFAL